MRTVGADFDNERAIVPGIGEYSGSRTFNDGQITLSKIDLIGGGFRSGDGGLALFPVKDVQGSVRGYASKNGLEQAIGYLPYGTTIYLDERFVDEGNKRWQGKEFDEEHEKYYFGARYYDPFFGMWMSPDPAGQFANPYSYGGDPLNYIDPTGMWAIGLGLVVGWNKENGWGFGYGGAVEFFDLGYDFSFKFNQDGSKSLNLGLNTKLDIQTIVYLEVEMGLAFSMSSYTGATLSTHRGVCVGEATACVGVGGGGSLYWDRGGSFMGATVYGEVYASLGFGMGRFSAGYEAGLFGMEGRGLYAGASAGGLYAQYAQNGGGSWGGDFQAYLAYGNNTGKKAADKKTTSLVSAELWLPTLGKFGHFAFGETYDVSNEGIRNTQLSEIISKLKNSSNPEDIELVKRLNTLLNDYNKKITPTDFQRIESALLRNGFESVNRPGDHGDGSTKYTYRRTGSSEYGNIEFMVNTSNAYCSYNYGNNHLTHILIDYLGWKGRGY